MAVSCQLHMDDTSFEVCPTLSIPIDLSSRSSSLYTEPSNTTDVDLYLQTRPIFGPPPPPVFEPPPERLLLSALDTQSGFIHLSAALQLPGTLERYFSDEAQV